MSLSKEKSNHSASSSSSNDSKVEVETVFISDVHLGTKNAQAQNLIDFLDCYNAKKIYLVGDIFDSWQMQQGAFWCKNFDKLLFKLLSLTNQNKEIIFIPGNHDEFLRNFIGREFNKITIKQNDKIKSKNGQIYIVMHGDEFDEVIKKAKWIAFIGDWGYHFAILINKYINLIRKIFGLPYWSFSAWAKYQVKKIVNKISKYEAEIAKFIKKQGADGIICGHIHKASNKKFHDIHYLNCGDWVESCTAIIENSDGGFELIKWDATQKKTFTIEKL